jgi:hypothetical protein
MLVRLEFTRMLGRRSVSCAAVVTALASLAASQGVQKRCKGGGKIALEVGYDVSSAVFTYHLSDPMSFSGARIEVWDRPLRLSAMPVPVRKKGEIEWAPKKNPPETPSWLFIGVVDPRGSSGTSKVFIGDAMNGGGPGASFPNQSFVLEEGASSAVLTIEGKNLNPVNHLLLTEQEASGTWTAREDLNGGLVDLQHVTVEIPSGYLSRPTVLNLQPMPPGLFSPGQQTALPWGGSITVHVMSKDRPVLSGIDPGEISADNLTDGVTARLAGSGFGPQSRLLVDLDGDVRDFATIFVSTNELQVKVDRDFFSSYSGARKADRFQVRVKNSDDLHVSDAQELRILPTANHPLQGKSVPLITSTSPYPVPLMDFQSPDFLSLAVFGENFREDNYVVLSTDNGPDVKLKTEYVSPQELRGLIPRELWKDHRYSYRLVTQTAVGTCSTEIWEEE